MGSTGTVLRGRADRGAVRRPYFTVSANPLKSKFTISPVCVPESSRIAPFWLVRMIAWPPLKMAAPA